jgi:dolichol-phosphate mannosyltransferase
MSIAAIIPALNEAETIGQLVRDLKAQGVRVIVVNDGSTDDTGSEALKAGADSVLYHAQPWNIGPSIIDGLKYAMRDGSIKRFVVIDAGGSHDPDDLPALLAVKADIVIGSRFLPDSAYIGTHRRRDASRLAAWMLNLTNKGYKLTDWTSGYRVYSREAVGLLIYRNYTAPGHAWQIECLAKAIRAKMSIKEAPISYIAGRSSLTMKSIDDAFSIWLELFFI